MGERDNLFTVYNAYREKKILIKTYARSRISEAWKGELTLKS